MKRINMISIVSVILTLVLSVPILNLFKNIFNKSKFEVLPSLVFEAIFNTLYMMFFVGIFTVILASSLAWIMNVYDFKFKRLFQVLLVMPFGIPAYIMGQSYADLLSFSGFFPTFIRNNYNIKFTIDVMTINGAIFIYTMALFPYIYLFCSSYYSRYAGTFVENSRLLGVTGFKLFRKVGFKIARVPIIAGLSLVMMEVISDYGVVSYFGIQAFTTILYKIWIGFNDFSSAIKLAAFIMTLIFILLVIEKQVSKRLRFYTSTKTNGMKSIKAKGKIAIFIYIYLSLVVILALILPLFELLYNNYYSFSDVINMEYIKIIGGTILYCSIGAFITVLVAFIFVNYTTNSKSIFSFFTERVSTLGYSIPGIIIAIAVMFSFHELDRFLRPLYVYFKFKNKLFLSQTAIILIFAYVVRFLTVAYNQIFSAKNKFNPNIFECSRLLGQSQFRTLLKIDLPLLMEANITAFFLIFLEILKELPITLLLKPIGLETLTIEVHKFYSNEMIKEASVPSLMIIIIGISLNFIILYHKNKIQEVK
ncbi:MAG: hypothetical protein CR959_00645 [Fusobacteriales bacterium]|nr:MAG: hypothetical protein CR959_00645 [Fusobacteriales bacterium]